MDLTQLSNEQLQQMFNMGSFAAGAELANRRQGDPYDFGNLYSEQKLGPTVPAGGSIYTSRFDKYAPSFMNEGIIQLTPETSDYEEDDGGITEYDTRNIFQRGLDYLSNNRGNIVRGGIGSLLGTAVLGPVGGILGGFLGQGIGRRGALQTFARSNTLMDFVDAMNRQKAVDAAIDAQRVGATGGDTFNFSDDSGYGGTGTSSPSNVGPGGRLGGGV